MTKITRLTTTDSTAKAKVVLRTLLLFAAIVVAPLSLPRAQSFALESHVPLEEQEEEKEQVISAAESFELRRRLYRNVM